MNNNKNIFKTASQIIEGWRNRLLPPEELKDFINSTGDKRMDICHKCPFHSKHHSTPLRFDDHCVECGCTLATKTKCLSCSCPKGYWSAEMTRKEEDELKKENNNG